MEGKENYRNEDEEQNSDSKKNEQESDDFGLPDIENTDDSFSDDKKKEDEYNSEDDALGSPYSDSWEEKKEPEEQSYSDPFAYNEGSSGNNPESEYNYESENSGYEEYSGNDDEYQGGYYEDEEKKGSPVGWIILIIILLIGIGIGIFWWFNREPATPKPTFQPPKQNPITTKPDTTGQITETPKSTPPPKAKSTPATSGSDGMISEISEPTGRYYVVIASFIDDDLAMDYAKKLSKEGITCKILDPKGNKKFFRFSIADFPTVNEAASRADQLKSTYGEGVWVMRY